MPDGDHVFHLYVVQVDNRDEILEKMRRSGIGVGIHYPIPLHMQPAYKNYQIPPESLPNTLKLSQKIMSLPMYPELSEKQIRTVVKVLKEVI